MEEVPCGLRQRGMIEAGLADAFVSANLQDGLNLQCCFSGTYRHMGGSSALAEWTKASKLHWK